LRNSFQSIDRLEKSEAKGHPAIEDIELFPWFAGIAAISGFAAALILSAKPT